MKPLVLAFLLTTCSIQPWSLKNSEVVISDDDFQGKATILSTSKGFRISLADQHGKQLDQIFFNYEPYQLDTADVNRDGKTDILLGLIKTTEFDPGEKKRLFILRIDEGQLRPLWLGSKVCQQLVDFKSSPNGIIKTLELTKSGNYAIGNYEWQDFGLTLLNYSHDEKPYHEAMEIFGG